MTKVNRDESQLAPASRMPRGRPRHLLPRVG
jgi:hypothetical protein